MRDVPFERTALSCPYLCCKLGSRIGRLYAELVSNEYHLVSVTWSLTFF